MVQLDTASICNMLPDEIAQYFIPPGQTKKTILFSAKQPYSPMTTLGSNLWVNCWDWLRSLQMKSIDVEHHMVPKHSQTSILKPQYSCQQSRPRTPETSLCYTNRYLHHTFDYFASKHTLSIPPCRDYSSVGSFFSVGLFPDVYTGLGQFGKPFSCNLNTLVTLVHD